MRGNLISVVRPDGTVTTCEYDASDRPRWITLPNGGRPRARAGQDSHLHRFEHGEPVGINGSGRETRDVEVVVRDGHIHTAYPV
ncbi:hypothetical protein APS67_001843 [Streptomyces sp. AVP053U2]|nr:hypothetical protein APS67_001843 [Streptomyces sp. AVP053U2]